MEKSAVVEHVWENHHLIHWEETTVLDHDCRLELFVKEALHFTHPQRSASTEIAD